MPNPTPTQQGETLEMPERIWLDVHEFALCCRNSEAGHYFLTPDKESVEYVRAAVAGPRGDAALPEWSECQSMFADGTATALSAFIRAYAELERAILNTHATQVRSRAAAPADNDAESSTEVLCACRTFNLDPQLRAFLDCCDFVHTVVACPSKRVVECP